MTPKETMSSRQNKGWCTYEFTDCDRTNKTHTSSNQIKSQHREQWAQSPTNNQKIFVTDSWWEKKNLFSWMEWHWIIQVYSIPILRNSWPTQNWQHYFVSSFKNFCYIFLSEKFCFISFFLFLPLGQKKKMMKI